MARDMQTYEIIGAAMEVHKELGPGFLEAVYHEALAVELSIRNVPFLHELVFSSISAPPPSNTNAL